MASMSTMAWEFSVIAAHVNHDVQHEPLLVRHALVLVPTSAKDVRRETVAESIHGNVPYIVSHIQQEIAL